MFYLFRMCLIRGILHVYDYIAFLLKIMIKFDLKLDFFSSPFVLEWFGVMYSICFVCV